ncbi:MAG: UvrB/UvrC motif-containing protein [Candidatus Heimdallarchaeota archaeon]
MKILNQLVELPDKTGVYLLRDEDENVIFVNFARNLSTQVRSHFHSNKRQDIIIKSKTRSIEFIVEEDVILAAKLELGLIRKYHPPLNQRGHDQKKYRFIELTIDNKYPSAKVTKILNDKKQVKIIGPFPKKSSIRQLFSFAINYFEIADCRQIIVTGKKNKIVSTCLRRKTKQCCRPCEVEIAEKEYSKKIADFIKFFDGGFPEIIEELEGKMKELGENFDFEKAALVRDDIAVIKQHINFKLN